jgi:hypothetical protein
MDRCECILGLDGKPNQPFGTPCDRPARFEMDGHALCADHYDMFTMALAGDDNDEPSARLADFDELL